MLLTQDLVKHVSMLYLVVVDVVVELKILDMLEAVVVLVDI